MRLHDTLVSLLLEVNVQLIYIATFTLVIIDVQKVDATFMCSSFHNSNKDCLSFELRAISYLKTLPYI